MRKRQAFRIKYDGEVIIEWTEEEMIQYKYKCLIADGFIKWEVEKWLVVANPLYPTQK